jgi:uncharacterized membrane protein
VLVGTDGLLHGGRAAVSAGAVVTCLAAALAIGLVAIRLEALLRGGASWRLVLAFGAGLLAVTAPQLLWPQVIWRPNAAAVLVGGVLALVLAWWPLASRRIIDQVTGSTAAATPRRTLLAVRWALPVSLAIAVLLIVLVSRRS